GRTTGAGGRVRRLSPALPATVWGPASRSPGGGAGWLFGPGAARPLRIAQAGMAVLIGLRTALGPYPALAGQPAALFRPRSVFVVLDAMPPRPAIVAVQVVGVVAAVAALVAGGRRRPALIVAWGCLFALAGLRGSLGKILHNDVLLLLAALPVVVARVRPARESVHHGWPVRTALVVTTGAYFFSGLAKLVVSGPAWLAPSNLSAILVEAAEPGRAPAAALGLFVAERPALAALAAAGILILELGFPAVLVSRRARLPFAAGAVAFHAGTWLTLGLDYWCWAAVVALVVPDWSQPRQGRLRP
ncbi:MAG: hypothetical protein ACRD0F_08090, partial [Acidimicrobiales bacterium]